MRWSQAESASASCSALNRRAPRLLLCALTIRSTFSWIDLGDIRVHYSSRYEPCVTHRTIFIIKSIFGTAFDPCKCRSRVSLIIFSSSASVSYSFCVLVDACITIGSVGSKDSVYRCTSRMSNPINKSPITDWRDGKSAALSCRVRNAALSPLHVALPLEIGGGF